MIVHAVLVVEPQEERRVNDIHHERRDAQRPLGRHRCPSRVRDCAAALPKTGENEIEASQVKKINRHHMSQRRRFR